MISAEEWQALKLSLLVAGTGTAAGLPLAIALGWLLARRSFIGKTAIETLVNLPLVLPPIVTGYALLLAFGQAGMGPWLERMLGVHVIFDWKGAAVAAAVMSFPLMARSIRLGFEGVDRQLERAARTLGASPSRVFVTISLPLAANALIAGCLLSFARGLGEFGATIMIAGSIPGQTRTAPLFIYQLLQTPGGSHRALRLIVASVLLAVAAVWIGELLVRRARAGRAAA